MMAILDVKQHWEKTLLGVTLLFVMLCVGIMTRNLFVLSNSVNSASGRTIEQSYVKTINREYYDGVVEGFNEKYVPAMVHKRNIFVRSKVEGPKQLIPSGEFDLTKIDQRLYVAKIYRKPVKLLFKGYIQMNDGVYVATINWADKTDFKKIGDDIRGYKIVDFNKNVSEEKTMWGGTEKVDKSVITLKKEPDEQFTLEIGKIALEKEIYAEVWDRKEMKSYELYVGSEFLGNKVLDISSAKVIITSSDGEKISLFKRSGE